MGRRQDPESGQRRRWRAEAGLAQLLISGLSRLPERAALAAGALGGRAALRLSRRHRERARTNVRIVYPGWSDERIDALLRASFAEMGRIVVEWARHPRLSPEQILERVDFHGLEHVEKALQRGRGAILVTAHYGHWELIPSAFRFRLPHVEMTPTGRTLGNPFVQAMVASRRNLGGGFVLERDTREIIRALRRNAAVGILVDLRRSRKRGGVLVPFLGSRAWTPHGPATIARRTGAAVIPAFTRRIEGVRHRIEFLPELAQPRGPDLIADTETATAELNDALARFILAEPSSWLWVHRRWRGSPDQPRYVYGEEGGAR
ncbi:MAG: lysophospholipid acyltransferase family protein [Candidatus Limnocylindria bacterium]